MGFGSGGGSSGGGGSFGAGVAAGYLLSKNSNSSIDPVAAIIAGVVLVGGLTALGFGIANVRSEIADARAAIEEKLAEDQNLATFDWKYFDWGTENSEYFLTFTGAAMKMDNMPLDFVASKYKIDQSTYYSLLEYIDEHEIAGIDESAKFLEMLLEVINQAELIDTNQVENMPTSVRNEDGEVTRFVSKLSKPVVAEDFVYYDVTVAKVRNKDDKGLIDLVTSRVYYEKTNELAANPVKAYMLGKEGSFVQKMSVNTFEVQNYDLFLFNNKTVSR